MKVFVLGAGVVGTTAAWYLANAGHEVMVIEREPEAGLETSFANGGQISVSHAEPWANPAAPFKVLRGYSGRTRRSSSGCGPICASGHGGCAS